MTFPYPTISSWFEANGDFEENLEDPRPLVEVLGDKTDAIVDPTVDEPVCEECGDPNPARTKNSKGTLMCEDCIDWFESTLVDEDWEPCCYNSTRYFGTGDHEWGCPNY